MYILIVRNAKIREQIYKNNTNKRVKKMKENQENEMFRDNLKTISEFLAQKQKLSELASQAKTSLTTVYETFKVESFELLAGKKLDVYQKAIEMVKQIKSLPQQANDAIK
jgi:methylphosphotriester-DNA--protein-cysteine methyltransferase